MDMILSYHGEMLIKNPQFTYPVTAGNVISLETQQFCSVRMDADYAILEMTLGRSV
jgi:hypothetical protein